MCRVAEKGRAEKAEGSERAPEKNDVTCQNQHVRKGLPETEADCYEPCAFGKTGEQKAREEYDFRSLGVLEEFQNKVETDRNIENYDYERNHQGDETVFCEGNAVQEARNTQIRRSNYAVRDYRVDECCEAEHHSCEA